MAHKHNIDLRSKKVYNQIYKLGANYPFYIKQHLNRAYVYIILIIEWP